MCSATTQLGRGQSLCFAFLLPPSFHSLPHPSHHPTPSSAQLPLRHVPGEQYPPAIPPPAVPLLPFFFIKLPKHQSVADVIPSQPVQLFCPTIAWRAPSSPRPCPSQWPACPPPFSLSPVSRCGLSTSSGAIGKQRPEMNYPVSSPSLMNK